MTVGGEGVPGVVWWVHVRVSSSMVPGTGLCMAPPLIVPSRIQLELSLSLELTLESNPETNPETDPETRS